MVTNTRIASNLELIVMRWLDRRGIIYAFQTSLRGGFYQLGGAVVDFIIPDGMLAWRIFGEYWHRGVEKEGTDLLQRELLGELGYTIVDLWGLDIENRLDETLIKALAGEEMLR